MKALVCASWGPNLATTKILHHCYVESIVRNGILAWYPFLREIWLKNLGVHYRKSIRIALQIPKDTWIKAIEEIAIKCAASLYTRLNPVNPNASSQTKTAFLNRTPFWMKLLDPVPDNLWKGCIHNRPREKTILTNDRIHLHTDTLHSQNEVDEVESNYNITLYTDASVNIDSNPPGKASIAYCWYKKTDNQWQAINKNSANVGTQHSSFSAEAVALIEALRNRPTQSQNIAIFTDSKSNIRALEKGIATSKEQQQLIECLELTTQKVDIFHVKAHTDIRRNSEVDEMANVHDEANKQNLQEWQGQKTAQKVKNWIHSWIRNENIKAILTDTKAIARNSKTQNLLKDTLFTGRPTQSIPSLHRNLDRKQGVLITQCRLNRFPMCNWYLTRIRKRRDPRCAKCRDEKCKLCIEHAKCETCFDPNGINRTDNVMHVLDECSRHDEERQALIRKLEYLTLKPSTLLYSRQMKRVKALADFIEAVDNNRREEEKEKLEEKRRKAKEKREEQEKEREAKGQKKQKKTRKTKKTKKTNKTL